MEGHYFTFNIIVSIGKLMETSVIILAYISYVKFLKNEGVNSNSAHTMSCVA